MSTRYRPQDLPYIVNALIEELRFADEGIITTTKERLLDAGYEREDFYRTDIQKIHELLMEKAKEEGFRLVKAEGSKDEKEPRFPYDIPYIIHNKNAQIKCPRCGRIRPAEILYGYPLFTDRLAKKIDSGRLILGGCGLISTHVGNRSVNIMPYRYCFECKRYFDAAPVALSKDKKTGEFYQDIVTDISFELTANLIYDHTSVKIRRTDNGAVVNAIGPGFTGVSDLNISKDKWDKILDKLFTRMYLHEWKKVYEPKDTIILDGDSWELKLTLSRGRKRTYRGYAIKPPYWKELMAIFKPYLRRRKQG